MQRALRETAALHTIEVSQLGHCTIQCSWQPGSPTFLSPSGQKHCFPESPLSFIRLQIQPVKQTARPVLDINGQGLAVRAVSHCQDSSRVVMLITFRPMWTGTTQASGSYYLTPNLLLAP